MHPLLRIWAIAAMCIALFLLLRGAWQVAIACFLFSPAPVLVFARGGSDQKRLSVSWLGVLAFGVGALVVLVTAVAYWGGVPPVHEWRAAMRSTGQ